MDKSIDDSASLILLRNFTSLCVSAVLSHCALLDICHDEHLLASDFRYRVSFEHVVFRR